MKFEIDQIMLPNQKIESFFNFTYINGESVIKIFIKGLVVYVLNVRKNGVLTIVDTRTMCDVPFFSVKINLDLISKAFGTVYSNHKK